jgi:protein SCO1
MTRLRIPRILLSSLAAVVVAAGLASCSGDRSTVTPELPVLREAPAFSAANYDGRTVTQDALRGRVWIAYFFFTSCSGPCPIMNSTANVLQAEFKGMSDLRIVGFTVDPDNDSVERLAKYAVRYNAQPGRWYMLRTDLETVGSIAVDGFAMGDRTTPALHSTRFALVDRTGKVRGYFDGTDAATVDALRAAIRALDGEQS